MTAMFSKPKTPTMITPVVMPAEDLEATRKAKKKSNMTATERSGRSSTLLAGGEEKLGGG